jgi:hypothetical protein
VRVEVDQVKKCGEAEVRSGDMEPGNKEREKTSGGEE